MVVLSKAEVDYTTSHPIQDWEKKLEVHKIKIPEHIYTEALERGEETKNEEPIEKPLKKRRVEIKKALSSRNLFKKNNKEENNEIEGRKRSRTTLAAQGLTNKLTLAGFRGSKTKKNESKTIPDSKDDKTEFY